MELRHLRYFVAVAEEQSFTKAAEKLFIAQPPLSRQIQNLEAELGISLFERGSRPLQLTEAGQFFYQHAVKLLSKSEEVKTMTKRIGSVERTLKIGFVGSLLYGLLPKIIYLFRQQQPQLKIELFEMNTMMQIQALKEGQIDVGFGRLKIADAAIKRILLRDEPLMVAMHSSHPLAQHKTDVSLVDLVDQHLFIYPKDNKPNFSTQVRSLFEEQGLEPYKLAEVREIQLALGLVAADEGICIVPQSACSIQFANLTYLPLSDSSAVSPIFMAIRQMDDSADLSSLYRCVHQVYDLEKITYDAHLF